LWRFLRGERIQARPVGPLGRFLRWCRRNRKVAALAATVVVLMLALTVVSFVFANRIATARDREHRVH